MKFRVGVMQPDGKPQGGSHDHTEPGSPSHGKRFFSGEVFQSKFDIRQNFVNKFERVDDATPLSPGRPIPGMERVVEDLAKIEAETPIKPTISTPAATKPAAQTETALPGPEGQKAAQDTDEGDDAADAADGPETPVTPHGKDVTKQFPKAVEEDYKVFKNGKAPNTTYAVYNADNMAEVASGLDRDAVAPAIAADLKRTTKA